MEINFVLPPYPKNIIGGYEVVFEYANYLVAHNHNVHLWFVDDLKWEKQKHFLLRYLVHKLKNKNPMSGWFQFSPDIKVHQHANIKDIKAGDVVVATAWSTALSVFALPAEAGRKFYFIQDDESVFFDREVIEDTWKLQMEKIVVASWLKEKIERTTNERVWLVKNFVKLSEFPLIVPINKRNPKKITMMFHEDVRKGTEYGLAALKIVKSAIPDIDITIFSVFKKPKNLEKYINFVENPSRKYLSKIYNESSIYIMPSIQEGWGLTATEAMASGVAVVSTKNGGVEDFGFNNVTAKIVPVKNEKLLAKVIIELLQNDDERRRIANNGYEYSKQMTFTKSAKLLEKIFVGSGDKK